MQMTNLFEKLDGVAQSARSLPHWGRVPSSSGLGSLYRIF